MSMKSPLKTEMQSSHLKKSGTTKKKGTRITFLPSKQIFSSM